MFNYHVPILSSLFCGFPRRALSGDMDSMAFPCQIFCEALRLREAWMSVLQDERPGGCLKILNWVCLNRGKKQKIVG